MRLFPLSVLVKLPQHDQGVVCSKRLPTSMAGGLCYDVGCQDMPTVLVVASDRSVLWDLFRLADVSIRQSGKEVKKRVPHFSGPRRHRHTDSGKGLTTEAMRLNTRSRDAPGQTGAHPGAIQRQGLRNTNGK